MRQKERPERVKREFIDDRPFDDAFIHDEDEGEHISHPIPSHP